MTTELPTVVDIFVDENPISILLDGIENPLFNGLDHVLGQEVFDRVLGLVPTSPLNNLGRPRFDIESAPKLHSLDLDRYPWQGAFIDELIAPFELGEKVKLLDGWRCRRLMPWEEDDSTAGIIADRDVWAYPDLICYKVILKSGSQMNYSPLESHKQYGIFRDFFNIQAQS